MTLSVILIYISTGLLAGALAGLLGLGGGIVIVPALAFIFSRDPAIPHSILMHLSAGTSLAAMLLIAQASVRSHAQHNRILWPIYYRMAWGLLLGTIFGVGFALLLNTDVLMLVFGVFLFVVAMQMLVTVKPGKRRGLPSLWKTRVMSFGIGSMSGLLGISGGTLTIPFFARCRLSLRKTTSVVALSSATVALMGTLFFILAGFHSTNLPDWTTGYVYWPAVLLVSVPSMLSAPFFTRLSYWLPIGVLRKGFMIFLLATSVHMLATAFLDQFR